MLIGTELIMTLFSFSICCDIEVQLLFNEAFALICQHMRSDHYVSSKHIKTYLFASCDNTGCRILL